MESLSTGKVVAIVVGILVAITIIASCAVAVEVLDESVTIPQQGVEFDD